MIEVDTKQGGLHRGIRLYTAMTARCGNQNTQKEAEEQPSYALNHGINFIPTFQQKTCHSAQFFPCICRLAEEDHCAGRVELSLHSRQRTEGMTGVYRLLTKARQFSNLRERPEARPSCSGLIASIAVSD